MLSKLRKFSFMEIITIANSKGGVGKTTTALALAHILSQQNYRCLVIDLDFQMNATLTLGVTDAPSLIDFLQQDGALSGYIHTTPYPNLDLLPANTNLIDFPKLDFHWLENQIKFLTYDFILIDNSPTITNISMQAFGASQHLIIPTTLHSFSLEGVYTLIELMSMLRKSNQKVCRILGVIVTFVLKSQDNELNQIKGLLGNLVIGEVPYSKWILTDPLDNVFGVHSKKKVVQRYRKITTEILRRIYGKEAG